MTTAEGFKLTVVMPALNEGECLDASIRNVVDSFSLHEINGELLVVDDGSTDRTLEIATGWARTRDFVRVIHHDSPKGIGASFWEGVKAARGEIVTMVPGDGENDASEIFRYLPLMDQVDIVVPFVFNPGVRPWTRRLLSFTYHNIIYMTFAISLNYLNGTVLYRKSIFEGINLKSRGFFYQTELLIKAIGRDYLYAEVPYALKKRHEGSSKATTLKSLRQVMAAYLATVMDVYSFRGQNFAGIVIGTATHKRLAELEREKSPPAGGGS